MNEFIAFTISGIVETFDEKFKDKAYYLIRIMYYSIALVFAIGIVYELVIYFRTETVEATIIGRLSTLQEREVLVYNFLFSLLFPLYAAYTLWFCQTKFDFKKISLSISLILATIVCVVLQSLNLLPQITGYNLTIFLLLPILTVALYLIISNSFSHKSITKFRKIWKRNQLLFVYLYVLLFVLFMLYYTEYEILNAVVNIATAVFMALMLIYVRRLLGFRFAVALHYILTFPVIIATGYMLVDQI